MRVRKNVKKRRMSGANERMVPKIKWEALQEESKKDEYKERTRVLLNEGVWSERTGEWEKGE